MIKEKKIAKANGINPCLNYDNIVIKQISMSIAKEFILQYEWLKNLGAAKYCFGLFIDNNLASVVCYTDPVSPNAYKKLIGIKTEKNILQLCRGASSYWAPIWAPSKLISYSLKQISIMKNAIAVIAYADPEAGEVGIIYQACNAVYIGLTNPGGAKYYIIKGKKYHPRKVHKLFGTRSAETIKRIDPNYLTKKIKNKHRYIFLMGNKIERKKILENLKSKIEEYPRRVAKAI